MIKKKNCNMINNYAVYMTLENIFGYFLIINIQALTYETSQKRRNFISDFFKCIKKRSYILESVIIRKI